MLRALKAQPRIGKCCFDMTALTLRKKMEIVLGRRRRQRLIKAASLWLGSDVVPGMELMTGA